MPVLNKNDDKVINLVRQEAAKHKATIKRINLDKQILDIECPDENKAECAVAIQKILDQHFQGS